MANIIILGGGFGGVVAAEHLARTLDAQHHLTLVSRADQFLFYPAFVRYAFGECERQDITFDLREAMLDRRIHFIKAEVARINPRTRRLTLAHGETEGDVSYDYLIFALGRRLATERVTGFFEHAHHLLTPEAALKFREAMNNFHQGRAVIGSCPGARLPIPVYETAFALSGRLKERGAREQVQITIVDPEMGNNQYLGGRAMADKLSASLTEHGIELAPDFAVAQITERAVLTEKGARRPYDLLMLIPPFAGAGAAVQSGLTDANNFIRVDEYMRVRDAERMYAVGDAVNFRGPKMGHMAVRQAVVAAENLHAELTGLVPEAKYEHEIKFVLDAGGRDSIYLHKSLTRDEEGTLKQGVFWRWAKRAHEQYWLTQHS